MCIRDSYNSDVIYTWIEDEDLEVLSDLLATYQSTESNVITLTANAGCGNIASAETTIFITSEPIQIQLVNDTVICFDGSAFLHAQSSGGTGELGFTWIGNNDQISGNPITVSPSFSSFYTVLATDVCGNQNDGEVYVEVQHAQALFEVSALGEDEYFFTPEINSSCIDCSYYWDFTDGSDSDLESVSHIFENSGYAGATLTVTTSAGCEATYTDLVNVPATVYIPNAFTPDNDGINDVWKVEISGISEFELIVYNRWGDIVFQAKDPEQFWKGEHSFGDYYVPNGVYSYVLKYRSLDSQAFTKKGSVSILR